MEDKTTLVQMRYGRFSLAVSLFIEAIPFSDMLNVVLMRRLANISKLPTETALNNS